MFNNLNLWGAVKIGGPVMYVLVICSVVSVAVIMERIYYFFTRSRISREAFMRLIREHIGKGAISQAVSLCQHARMPFASVVEAGLNAYHLDEQEITHAMERKIIIEINDLERLTAIVGTIGSTAVYIGLLGTVGGIITTFRDMYRLGSSEINVVIHGIAEALVCTAAGLLVAIPAVAAYNYFVKRVNSFVSDMELCASETSSRIKERKSAGAKSV